MKTSDIFNKLTSKRINETVERVFGNSIDLSRYSTEQLEDARNKLRTQVHQYKQSANFNETVDNETFTKAQWMLDAINSEIAERSEFIVANAPQEVEEHVESGEEMTTQIKEGATDQASAVVTANTMVDRVGRWIEELASMENDQLLDLGDIIRDEMGQEQAKSYVSSVAPSIQQALETLKATREALSNGVRMLVGDAQPEDMLGAEPEGETPDMPEPAAPDAMNAEPEAGAEDVPDDFSASEPAAGPDEAGRAKRESIERQNNLLKTLAG